MSEKTLYQILQAAKYSKTLSEIAEKLYFSQPYVSKVIKRAEKKYNSALINRSTIPIALTNSGNIVLEHLRIILNTEADLKYALHNNDKQRTIKVLVTNPFLYDLVVEEIATYIGKYPENNVEISSTSLQNGLKSIKDQSYDIVIGRRYIDENIITTNLSQNQVFFWIRHSCPLYVPNKLVLPFKIDYLKYAPSYNLITFNNIDGIQDYIIKKFKELGITLRESVKVDTVAQACLMADSLSRSGLKNILVLINNYVAKKIFPKENYNLLKLPDNLLHFDNAIMVSDNCSNKNLELRDYLKERLSEQLKIDKLD